MKKEDLQIVKIRDLLMVENLSIPPYQRPYRWTTDSAVTLFSDIYEAFTDNVPEYRIGTVVLHRNNNSEMEIVDGQQRLTTLSILLYCFSEVLTDKKDILPNLINAKYTVLSTEAIVENHQVLLRKVKELDSSEMDSFLSYLLEKCTMVKIVTENEQEAFQFFDSQNSRGKELAPHDLLKSYHLREMNEDDESLKKQIIEKWEATNQKELELLFKDYLYPLVCWYKYKYGLGYSSKDIKTFKGIKKNNKDNKYNFSIYHRAANLYIESFNREGMYELTSGELLNQFQLTQPIIAGKRFFEYSLHYLKLKEEVEKQIYDRINGLNEKKLIPEIETGDGYIKNLFINIIVFYVDRFNMESLSHGRLVILYKWAYSLRLVMKSVYKETINNYARGKNDRINKNLNMFERISEMTEPAELDSIILDKVDSNLMSKYKVNISKYEHILNFINK